MSPSLPPSLPPYVVVRIARRESKGPCALVEREGGRAVPQVGEGEEGGDAGIIS